MVYFQLHTRAKLWNLNCTEIVGLRRKFRSGQSSPIRIMVELGSGAEAKNMKKMLLAMAFAVLALVLPTLSLAGPILAISFGGTPCGSAGICTSMSGPGLTIVNFDAGLPGSPLYTLSGGATLATGTNLPFWRAPTNDTTQFITTEAGTIDITKLPKGDTYYGLYIGSLDTYNTITF